MKCRRPEVPEGLGAVSAMMLGVGCDFSNVQEAWGPWGMKYCLGCGAGSVTTPVAQNFGFPIAGYHFRLAQGEGAPGAGIGGEQNSSMAVWP